MLPTFVIGLREGLEAALIVGIIAAFVSQQGRKDLLRWVWAGIAAAVLLCFAVGVGLEAASAELPQKQQEGLETVVGVLAVGMVTYMVVWMRRNSRGLKKQLEGLAADAMAQGAAGRAMVLMAFLAVLREGFETVVFLLAAFHESGNATQAGGGALAGIAVAVLLGYGVYRGGVRLNLSKFFRATGIVLVLVAAGLVATALHTAHEAGWLNAGQQSTVDLSGVVRPGSVQSALLTGMLGVQQHPVLIEVVGWLVYLVPVGLFVAWPPTRSPARATLARAAIGVGGLGAVTAIVLVFAAPPAPHTAAPAAAATFRVDTGAGGGPVDVSAQRTGAETHDGIAADVYTATHTGAATGRPASVSYDEAAQLNGGRLPLGVRPANQGQSAGSVRVDYTETTSTTLWVEPTTGRVIDLRATDATSGTLVGTPVGAVALDKPVATVGHAMPAATAQAAAAAARHDLRALDRRDGFVTGAWLSVGVTALACVYALWLATAARRERRSRVTQLTAETSVSPSG